MIGIMKAAMDLTAVWYAVYAAVPALVDRMENWIKRPVRLKNAAEEKVLYLTFDDGPSEEYTPLLLDLLKENQIQATFFVVADFAEKNPEIVKRMKEDGHLIGVHSMSHKCAMAMLPKNTKKDAAGACEVVKSLGVNTSYFRPPWGLVNLTLKRFLKKSGLSEVLWDVMAGDWSGKTTAEAIEAKLRKRVKSGSVICLHDGRGKNEAPSRTIKALSVMLPEWKAQNYSFLRIDEMPAA